MHRYGVLSAYWPSFARIVGRMQYDLFHTYTVDEHILFVLRNVRRFDMKEYEHELPFCSQLIKEIPKPELLYLAALFHDIAKGRGGDHSILGAEEAETFCLQHDLSGYDARLVAWLVRYHLLMSLTAQRQDISDPDVINDFARKGRQPEPIKLSLPIICCGYPRDQPQPMERLERFAADRALFRRQARNTPGVRQSNIARRDDRGGKNDRLANPRSLSGLTGHLRAIVAGVCR